MLLDLQLKIKIGRDRNSSMTDWVDDEIQGANERAQQREHKLARRDSDAKIIERDRGKFWSALMRSLADSVDRFNNRPGQRAASEIVEISDRDNGTTVYIRTPGYPKVQLFLQFREGMNDILLSFTEFQTTSSAGTTGLKGTLDFDANESGQIIVRDDGSCMDVHQTTEYLLRRVFPYVSSGRD